MILELTSLDFSDYILEKFRIETEEKKISRADVPKILKATKGKLFSVKFIKKNGETRILNGRLGVTRYLKGGYDTTSHIKYYINVYDIQKKGYRKVNMNTVERIKYSGITYIVEE
jgi:hypothetical protein